MSSSGPTAVQLTPELISKIAQDIDVSEETLRKGIGINYLGRIVYVGLNLGPVNSATDVVTLDGNSKHLRPTLPVSKFRVFMMAKFTTSPVLEMQIYDKAGNKATTDIGVADNNVALTNKAYSVRDFQVVDYQGLQYNFQFSANIDSNLEVFFVFEIND